MIARFVSVCDSTVTLLRAAILMSLIYALSRHLFPTLGWQVPSAKELPFHRADWVKQADEHRERFQLIAIRHLQVLLKQLPNLVARVALFTLQSSFRST